MITLEQFQDGFGDDTLAGGVFSSLPPSETPESIIVKSVKAYKVAQDAYNQANPLAEITLVGPTEAGSTVVSNGSINQIQSVVLTYKANYDFDTYLPG